MAKKNIIDLIPLILLIMCILAGCSKSEVGSSDYTYNYDGYSEYTYTFNLNTFSFKYPESWVVEEEPVWEASEGVEASPDWGARAFIEGNLENYIYIFGSFSPRTTTQDSSFTKKDFIVEGVRIGSTYIRKVNGMVEIYVLYDKLNSDVVYNAIVIVTNDFYNHHKDAIWHIISSIKY